MSLINKIIEKAQSDKKTIVLPEGQDPRIISAANKITEQKIAEVIVLGTEKEIQNSLSNSDETSIKFQTIDPLKNDKLKDYATDFLNMRKAKGKEISDEKALATVSDRLFFGNMMVKTGKADGLVAGSIASTGDMLRASFTVIGTEPGIKTGSSCFLMALKTPTPSNDKNIIFADCGVNPDPSAEELVDIAIASAQSYCALVGDEPKLAFLSFSSHGSAKHPALEKIIQASKLTKEKVNKENLNIIFDGELQVDAAIVPAVANSKVPSSPIKGSANILIFPDLNSGNIAYKLTQYLAGAQAYGPILQGLAKPVNDLSRGCSTEDIIGVTAITSCQAIEKC